MLNSEQFFALSGLGVILGIVTLALVAYKLETRFGTDLALVFGILAAFAVGAGIVMTSEFYFTHPIPILTETRTFYYVVEESAPSVAFDPDLAGTNEWNQFCSAERANAEIQSLLDPKNHVIWAHPVHLKVVALPVLVYTNSGEVVSEVRFNGFITGTKCKG